jgi:hypothetical protein
MDAEAITMAVVQPGLLQAVPPIPPERLAAVPLFDVPMGPLQAAVPIITDHLQTMLEPYRERVLLPQEAAVHRTGRFIQGPAPQPHKAGRLIRVHQVVQHQDPRDHQHIAGQVLQDHPHTADQAPDHPIAGPVHPDRHLIADRAVVPPIPVEAGQADRQDHIPVAADRQAVVHPTPAADPGQAAVRVQVAQEDNRLLPRLMPGL